MNEPTNDEKCRVVAGRLGLMIYDSYEDSIGGTVDFPPRAPDFLQPTEAWRLVEALWGKFIGVELLHRPVRIRLFSYTGSWEDVSVGVYDGNLAQALLDAAFAWAKGDGQ